MRTNTVKYPKVAAGVDLPADKIDAGRKKVVRDDIRLVTAIAAAISSQQRIKAARVVRDSITHHVAGGIAGHIDRRVRRSR